MLDAFMSAQQSAQQSDGPRSKAVVLQINLIETLIQHDHICQRRQLVKIQTRRPEFLHVIHPIHHAEARCQLGVGLDSDSFTFGEIYVAITQLPLLVHSYTFCVLSQIVSIRVRLTELGFRLRQFVSELCEGHADPLDILHVACLCGVSAPAADEAEDGLTKRSEIHRLAPLALRLPLHICQEVALLLRGALHNGEIQLFIKPFVQSLTHVPFAVQRQLGV
mmetsp:Transcript_63245/g.104465  ORF Transcript_63245/g.104465 Transcript_63245/m.104465 type:complete len:221 (-) Transcript_63245:472-1134(-)